MNLTLVQALFLVEDLELASEKLRELGLDVIDGGRHSGRGTANRIVPLGEQYLELLAVVDEQEASASPMGRPVLQALASRGEGLARWSVTTAELKDLEGVAARLKLPLERRHRTLPDGTVIRWQSVGVNEAWEQPWRCAFMAWENQAQSPAKMLHSHPNQASAIASIEVCVPGEAELADWLDGPPPRGVKLVERDLLKPTELGPVKLSLRTDGGELSLA